MSFLNNFFRVEEYWRREKERQLQEAARRNEERKRVEAEKRAKLDAEWAQQSQKNDLNQLPDESKSIEVEVCRFSFLPKHSTRRSVLCFIVRDYFYFLS